jgi:outer membrane protein assembly factor BamB
MTRPDQRRRDASGTESTITRRAVVGGLGAVGFGLGLTGLADGRRRENPVDPEGSWPSYAGDVANTGWVAGPDGVATAVEERWAVESEPRPNELSVHGGRVYLSLDDGESDPYVGAVRALDAETGEQQWRFETDRWMQSTPVVRGDAVYALANGDGEGYVYELDASDGSERWSHGFGREVVAALSVVDGTVYVGRIDGGVVALSREGGSEQWRAITEADVWYPPAVVDGAVYVTGDRGGRGADPPEVTRVHALDAETGERQWRYEVGGVGAPSPVVAGETVYVSDYEGGLRAVADDDGTERWTFDVDDHGGTPTVHDGTVYLAGPTTLYALDAADGGVRWRVDCESDAATPAGTTDALYAVLDGRLTAVDPSTGETRVLESASGWVTAVAGDTVYLRSDRTVRAVTVTERASGLPTPTPSPTPTSSPSPTSTPSPTATPTPTEPPETSEGDDSTAPAPTETTSGTGALGVVPAVGGAVGLGVLGAVRARLRDEDDGST